MADGGSVRIKILGDNSPFKNAMDEAQSSAQKTGTSIADIFKGVMASQIVTKGISMVAGGIRAAVDGAITLGKTVVGAYADYEQLVGGIDTLFKDSSRTVQQYAANAYKTAGLSANAYMETATGFAASLISSLGGDTQKAAEMADMAITDMSDNANKMGTDMSSIQNAYQGFAKKNYTMLDNLKLGYGGTREEMARLLEDAGKVSGIEYDIDSYADIVDAIHVIQTEMGITGTTAQEAEHTISGSINTLKGAVQNLLVGMGDANADMTELFGNVTEALDNVISNILPVVERVFNDVLPGLVDMIGQALPGLLDGILDAAPTIVSSLGGVLQKVFLQLSAKLPELVKTLAKGLPAALRGLMDMLPELVDNAFELATSVVTGLIEQLPELIPMLVEGIVRLVPKIIAGVANAVVNVVGSIWDVLMGSPKDMTEKINAAFQNIDTSRFDSIVGEIKAEINTEVEVNGDPEDMIRAKMKSMYDTIAGIFTDGLPDDEEAIATAKQAVQDYVDGAQAKVDEWYRNAMAQLEVSGLTGEELQAAKVDIQNVYDSATATIQETGDAAYSYIDTNAGKSTETCQAALEDLWTILDQVGLIDAEMARVSEKAFGTTAAKQRRLVQAGAVSDEKTQLLAFAYTAQEYADAIEEAEQVKTEALNKAAEDFAGNSEGYAKEEKKILEAYNKAVSSAEEKFDEENRKNTLGVLMNDSEAGEAIKNYQNLSDGFKKLQTGIASTDMEDFWNSGKSFAEWFDEWFNALDTGMTQDELAEKLGVTPEDMRAQIMTAIEQPFEGNGLGPKLSEEMSSALADTKVDLTGTDGAAVVAKAVEEGWLTPAGEKLEDFDFAGLLDDSISIGMEEAGEMGGDGIVTGLGNKESAVYKAAWRLGMGIKQGVTDALQIASPSKVMKELGLFAGEGLDIGLTESVGNAIDNMRNLITGINMTPKMDLSSIQGQLSMINQAQGEQGDVILQLNGRALGRAAAADMNTAVNGYTRRIAMGYGRG